MADIEKKTMELELDERVFDVWSRRNPRFDASYKDTIIKVLCDYKVGSNQYSESKAKILGPGYESFIMAFFIGLYSGHRKPFDKSTQTDVFGWPIENWSGSDRGGRRKYRRLTLYMFIALVAKVDVDWLAVDEGKKPVSEAATELQNAMEEYANYGYSKIDDIMKDDPTYFASEKAFFEVINEILEDKQDSADDDDSEPESLD